MTGKKITIALSGQPPSYEALPFIVALENALFPKFGVDVEIKFMKSGAAAAKAVVQGQLDLALAPTQFAVRLMANASAPLKAVWGLDRPDWLLGSMDAGQLNCAAMTGARIGVDAKRGARWTQLNTILTRGCKLAIDKQVKTVALGSGVARAMSAGKLVHGILHIDELKAIEHKTGKKVHVITTLEAVAPSAHHMMLVAGRAVLETKRDAIVGVIAALRDACAMINDPAAITIVTQSTRPSRESKTAKATIMALTAMSFYPRNTPGLDKARVEQAIAHQIRIGRFTKGRRGIVPQNAPPTYDAVTDVSLWADARGLK